MRVRGPHLALHFYLRVTMEQHDDASFRRVAAVKVAHVALCCSSGTWSAPMPTHRTPVRGHESCPCNCTPATATGLGSPRLMMTRSIRVVLV
jgi:hypothetical protein